MLKFFLIKQVQYNYTIDKIRTYWSNLIRDTLVDDANPTINLIISEIDNLLGKNPYDSNSSEASDESDDSDKEVNRTVNLNFNKKLAHNEVKLKENFKDTSNLNKTSKVTKKMLDQIHNPIISPMSSLSNKKILRGTNIEYNGPALLKRETDTSTKCSVKIIY
jgi:hypothetical protein